MLLAVHPGVNRREPSSERFIVKNQSFPADNHRKRGEWRHLMRDLQLLGIFSPLLSVCRRNAAISSALIYGLDVPDRGRLLRAHAGVSGAGGSHLSSLVLEPHLHHPDAEPRLRRQGLPHLKAPRQTRFQHLAVKEGSAASPRPRIFPALWLFLFRFFGRKG